MTLKISCCLWATLWVLLAASSVWGVSDLEGVFVGKAADVAAARANRQARFRTRASIHNGDDAGMVDKKTKDCIWDGQCRASPVRITEVFEGSKVPYVRFIAQYARCNLAPDEESCDTDAGCLWTGTQCIFLEVDLGHKDSVCVKGAPSFFYFITYGATCLFMQTKNACKQDPYCIWDDASQLCDTDGLLAWTGLSSEEFRNISSAMAPEWQQSFQDQFDYMAPDFDSGAVLKWKPPKATCPEWAEEWECDLAYALISPTLPKTSYCLLKYLESTEEECRKDKLCEVDPSDGTCIASESQTRTSFYEVVFPFMKTKLDRKIVAKFVNCFQNKEPRKCKGKCVWLGPQGCMARESWVLKKVASVDKKGDDVVCKYLSLLGSSGCNDIIEASACAELGACTWSERDAQCGPKPVYWLSTAVELDEEVKGTFIEVSTKCISIATRKECQLA